MTTKHLLAALVCFAGCIDANDTDTDTTTQELVLAPPAPGDAKAMFTDAVATVVRNNASARLPITSPIATSRTARNAIATAASGDSQLFFVEKSFGRSALKPGLYQIKPSKSGALLYRYDPTTTGGPTLVGPIQKDTQVGDPDWMCQKAPDLIHEYCLGFVWCAGYDVGCPLGLPGVTWVG